MPRRVVAVIWDGQHFVLGAVDEGVPGYWPLDALGRWIFSDMAQKEADDLNAQMGIPPNEARAIADAALRDGPLRRDIPPEAQPRLARP